MTVVKVESSRYAMAVSYTHLDVYKRQVLFIVQGLLIAYKAENLYCTMVGIGIMAQIAWQVFLSLIHI